MSSPALLIVEDDQDTLLLTTLLFEGVGFRVTTATSVADARQQLTSTVFDAIVADMFVDSSDIDVATTQLCDLMRLADVTPTVIVTGAEVTRDVLEMPNLRRVLRKPVSRADLIGAVAWCTQRVEVEQSIAATLRAYLTCLERSTWSMLDSLCTPDVRYRAPGLHGGLARNVQGVAALRQLASESFASFEQPRFTINTLKAMPAGTMVRYNVTWIDGQGVRIGMDGSIFFTFRGELIDSIEVRLDLEQLVHLETGASGSPTTRGALDP